MQALLPEGFPLTVDFVWELETRFLAICSKNKTNFLVTEEFDKMTANTKFRDTLSCLNLIYKCTISPDNDSPLHRLLQGGIAWFGTGRPEHLGISV